MRQRVDFECKSYVFFGGVEDIFASCDAGVLMRIVGSPTSLRILAAVEAMSDKEVMSHL